MIPFLLNLHPPLSDSTIPVAFNSYMWMTLKFTYYSQTPLLSLRPTDLTAYFVSSTGYVKDHLALISYGEFLIYKSPPLPLSPVSTNGISIGLVCYARSLGKILDIFLHFSLHTQSITDWLIKHSKYFSNCHPFFFSFLMPHSPSTFPLVNIYLIFIPFSVSALMSFS